LGVTITHKISPIWCRAVLSALLIALLVWPTSLSADSTQSGAAAFTGRATVVRATVRGITTAISDTRPLPASGGAPLPSVGAPGLLTADVAHATTVGHAERARSEASVADLSLTVGGNTIAAGTLRSSAMAVCMSRARSRVNASTTPMRTVPHDSVPTWAATSRSGNFFFDCISPVLIRGQEES